MTTIPEKATDEFMRASYTASEHKEREALEKLQPDLHTEFMDMYIENTDGDYKKVNLPRMNLFINNTFVLSKKTLPVIDPSTLKTITAVSIADETDVCAAVCAARHAFDCGPWSTFTAAQRSALLNRLADLIEKDKLEIACLESLDVGKPLQASLEVDIPHAVGYLRYYASLCDKLDGRVISSNDGLLSYVLREPIGVLGLITPWNFPLLLAVMKMAIALSVGNTVVLKSSEHTPLTSCRLAELVLEAGFPAGVINIITGLGAVAGEALVKHPKVDMISFTGSTRAGKLVLANTAETVKRVSVELGGKSAAVICADADLKQATTMVCDGMFENAGQSCIALSRVYVHESHYDDFLTLASQYCQNRKIMGPFISTVDVVDAFVDSHHAAKKIKCSDSGSNQGPMTTEAQFEKTINFIQSGIASGARLVTGGKQVGNTGRFIQPTIFADVTNEMSIARDEIFGPVMCVMKFSECDEVLKRVNDSRYGLWSNVHTKDIKVASKFARGIKAGTVAINCNSCKPQLPFGGYKESGRGREGGIEALSDISEIKVVTMSI